ncbi:arginase family protein [Plantibacter sp. YIM 135249]|uniref:arginase family protein n=1 Tax=Plantibacter sp. YIM 135249 TaxID=3423918 RepID=UPI003D344798
MTSFVVVPQWQGSGSSRAMQLVDGAQAIRGDLPSAATTVVDVPIEAGESLGTGIRRLSTLTMTAERQRIALGQVDGPVITIGGDCGVEFASVQHAIARTAPESTLALVWFDAHGDLNTPAGSRTGAFSGMVARALLGDGEEPLVASPAVDPSRFVLVGARDLDDAEVAYLAETPLPVVDADTVTPAEVVAAVESTGATHVYIHVDLDVLDPSDLTAVSSGVPFGVPLARLVETVTALKQRFGFAGAGVTGFAPSSAAAASDDLGTILRIIGALSREPKPVEQQPAEQPSPEQQPAERQPTDQNASNTDTKNHSEES